MSRRGSTAAPLERAAGLLRGARRVLVTGFGGATLEAVQAACDVAEDLGAAIDAGDADVAGPAGPVMARSGAITADFEELRDRADLVILWCCDPDRCRPGFRRDHVDPDLPGGSARLVLTVGPEPVAGRHLAVPDSAAVDAARLLHAILLGHAVPDDNPAAAAVAETCRSVAAAIRGARCVGIVDCRDGDPRGLSAWAVQLLVRAVNHERPAFAVPLPDPTSGGSATAAAVLTWRYGAAGAIARADRFGGDFRPAECSAATIIARGEVDAVLVVGRPTADVEEAIASRAADLALVRIDDRDDVPPGGAGPCVHLRGGPGVGTVLRADGREAHAAGPDAGVPDPQAAILASLRGLLATGRPA